jgi:Fe-S-cluster containining protein
MALLPEEKQRLEVLAKRRGLSLDLAPLTWNGFTTTLYQFAKPVCPFLDNDRCTIYQWRPLACRMFPLHPYGVSHCTALYALQKRGFQVDFPPQLKQAALRYMRLVVPRIKTCVRRYNLNRGWETPYPFTFRSTYGNVPR